MSISRFYQELHQWWRYGVAVLTVAIALLVKLLLNSLIEQETVFYLIFFPAVLVSAWYGGIRAGVLVTFLAALENNYFFLSPAYWYESYWGKLPSVISMFINPTLGQNLQLFLFVVEGIATSLVVGSLTSASQQVALGKVEKLDDDESLRQSEERFRLLVKDVKDYAIFMINPNGQVSSWNAGGEHIFGYSESEIIGQPLSCIFTPEDIQNGLPKRELKAATTLGQAYEECQHMRQNGTRFWASGVVTALRDEDGNLRGFSKVVRDVTERKLAEERVRLANDEIQVKKGHHITEIREANKHLQSEIVERQKSEEARKLSEERLRLALQLNQASTWDWDMVSNKFIWCHNHELLFGFTADTCDGTYQALLERIHPKDRQLVIQAIACAVETRTDYDQEYRIIWTDGSIHWLAVKGKVFYDKTDQAVRMVGLSVDITNLKQTTEQIAASLQEKEVLLKEIHHRVKNNLQIVSSLLNLQSGYIEDQKTQEIFKQCDNRVGAMALIHEQLYQSHDLAKIEFGEYVKTLVANLFSSYGIYSEEKDENLASGIAVKIDVDNIFLSVDTAIPCGLIINELVSNSIKYAFLPSKKGDDDALPKVFSSKHCIGSGKICIGLHADNNNHLTLSISDDGIGFPEDLDFRNTESLGLQIVSALTNQLEGTIELNRSNGTEFEIKFY